MQKKTLPYSLIIASLLLGFVMAVQIRTNGIKEYAVPLQRARAHDLTVELKDLQVQRSALEAEVNDLQRKISTARGKPQLALTNELEKLNIAAGLIPMTGPGIEVKLENEPETDKPGNDPDLFIIRDEDLLRIINEIRAAGAEVISLNDQRITANTEIRLAGSSIVVNLKRIGPPYRILAIGDPAAMESALKVKGGLVETLDFWGIKITVAQKERVNVPAYKGTVKFDFSKPLKEGA